ncbi:AAA family ATPase [Acidobacteriota bacterium]
MNTKNYAFIGLTGTNASGKGEAARFFKEAGFEYCSLSDLIREEVQQRGEAETRDNLIRIGNELRENYGPDVLARRILEKIGKKTVIDSIRNPHEIDTLRTQPDFILLAIDAPVESRYERSKFRGRNESVNTLEEFIAKEEEEITDNEKGQQLRNCMDMADALIMNDGSLDEFYAKLEKFL